MTFICGCCGELCPTIHRHYHHKTPQSVGGPDTPDNIIQLCPGCHDGLHAIATKMVSRKFSQAKVMDTLQILYKANTKAQKMCLELATRVRDAIIKSREEGLDPNQMVTISAALPKAVKDLATVRARDMLLTQEAYLKSLILGDLTRKYGSHPILSEFAKTIGVRESSRRKK